MLLLISTRPVHTIYSLQPTAGYVSSWFPEYGEKTDTECVLHLVKSYSWPLSAHGLFKHNVRQR